MNVKVGIVDYQMGNLRSVQKGVEKVGFQAVVSSDRKELSNVSHLILPGVGAFGDAMLELQNRDLIGFLQDWAAANKPFLGICLGMQLLFDSSEEGGMQPGLSILPGQVVRFSQPPTGETFKIPHMGWNQVSSTIENDGMLKGLTEKPFMYFVHSYYVRPKDNEVVWLQADYGQTFCAAVRRGNILATQFHPEKSQRDGLQLVKNFLSLSA